MSKIDKVFFELIRVAIGNAGCVSTQLRSM